MYGWVILSTENQTNGGKSQQGISLNGRAGLIHAWLTKENFAIVLGKPYKKDPLVDPPLVTFDQVGYLGIITKRPAELLLNCWTDGPQKYHTGL